MWIPLRNSLSPFCFIISSIVKEKLPVLVQTKKYTRAEQQRVQFKETAEPYTQNGSSFFYSKWDHAAKSHWDSSIHSSPQQKMPCPKYLSIQLLDYTTLYSFFIFGVITNITQHGKSSVLYQGECKTNWNKKSFVFLLHSSFVSPGYFPSVFRL